MAVIISNIFKGPSDIPRDVEAALCFLCENFTHSEKVGKSHLWQKITNLNDPDILTAIAVYLVGSFTNAIGRNLSIRSKLFFDAGTLIKTMESSIGEFIGSTNDEVTAEQQDFKTKTRDPWIWEGISHLIVHLSRYSPNYHSPGSILATTGIKLKINDSGMDLIGIYKGTKAGVVIGESKAYSKDPAGGVTDAANKLSEVDQLRREDEIRAAVSDLTDSLEAKDFDDFHGEFWHHERNFIPAICCDRDSELNWSRKRKVLNQLDPPLNRKILLPLVFEDVRNSFDFISDVMRAYPTHVGNTDV